MLEEHKPDVLCVCESKLDSAISDSAVLPPSCGYEIINSKDHRLGAGGVLIAVKNTFVASPVMDFDTDCEVTWSRIKLANNKPLFIGSFYRTLSIDDPVVFNKVHESVSRLTCRGASLPNIILNGDFNIPDINWENSSISSNPNYSTILNNAMLDFVNTNYLTQMTDKPIRNDNVLDLTLITNPDLISDLEIQPGMIDHCAVTYNVNLAVKRQRKPDRYVYQYRKGDLEGVKRDLGEFKEKFLSNDPLGRPVDDNSNLCKDALSSSIKRNIPQKKIPSRWNLPWMTPEIKRLHVCRKKKRAWDAGRHNRNSHYWKRYLKLSKLVKDSIQESHRTYVDNILNVSINDNP